MAVTVFYRLFRIVWRKPQFYLSSFTTYVVTAATWKKFILWVLHR